MSVQLMEGMIAAGFGAAESVIGRHVHQRLPGNIAMGVGLEAGAILVGLFGQKVGIGADIRDPLLISALTITGARLTTAAQTGNLMKGPAAWGGGGEGGEGGHAAAVAAAPAARSLGAGRNWAPGIRRLGQGGLGTDLYPNLLEQGGVAS